MKIIRYILFFFLVIYTLQKGKIVEGIERSCCGVLSSDLIVLTCSDLEVPPAIKRCFPLSKDTFECDECDDICKYKEENVIKKGECIPTSEGGYCKVGDDHRIFKGGEELEPLNSSDEEVGDKINDDPRAMSDYREENAYKCSLFDSRKTSSDDEEDDSDFDEFEQEFGSDTEVDEGGSPLSFVSEGWFDFISFENIIKLMALLVIIGLVAVIILKGNLGYRLKMLRMKSFKDLF